MFIIPVMHLIADYNICFNGIRSTHVFLEKKKHFPQYVLNAYMICLDININ